MSIFKFNLAQNICVTRSGEFGAVDGRAEYSSCGNQYLVKYTRKSGDSASSWFDENELSDNTQQE